MSELGLYLSLYVSTTEVEGPGKRFAIWLGSEQSHYYLLTDLLEEVDAALDHLDGVTVLGEEPIHQSLALAEWSRLLKVRGLSVMVHSGRSFRELRSIAVEDKGVRLLLTHIDLLVCGRYLSQLSDSSRLWVGSTNQTIHQLGTGSLPKRLITPKELTLECRIQRSHSGELLSLIHGHSHEREIRQQSLESGIPLSLAHLTGQQWLDDLFIRETPTVDPSATWQADEIYWALALDRSRKRCLKWLMSHTGDKALPLLIDDRVVERHPLDQDLDHLPLSFKEHSEAILAGPQQWSQSLRSIAGRGVTNRAYQTDLCKPFCYNLSVISIGDWSLLASLATKMLRTSTLRWLCLEMVGIPLKQRGVIEEWFIRHSPYFGLMRPQKSVLYFTKISDQEWSPQAQAALSLITPSLAKYWLNDSFIERLAEGFISSDSWTHLKAIYSINIWAASRSIHALGEACLKTIDSLLLNIEPNEYFQVSVSDMQKILEERRERLTIVSAPLAWRDLIEKARSSYYGAEEEATSQLTLRYAQRWSPIADRLAVFERYGASLVSEYHED